MGQDTATARVIEAIGAASAARVDGRPGEGLPRLRAVQALAEDSPLTREVALAMLLERGLCQVALDDFHAADLALTAAMELCDADPMEADPVRSVLATLRLMNGDAAGAQELLAGHGDARQRDPALLRGAPDRPRLEFEEDAGAAWRDSISILGFKTEDRV